MKQILPAGERCVLLRKKFFVPKYSKPPYLLVIISIFLILCLVFPSFGQSTKFLPKPITVGNKLAKKIIIGEVLSDSMITMMVGDYRGKGLIIDFWGTSCATCIAKFPLLDSLSKKHDGHLTIILANYMKGNGDTKERVEKFMKSFKVKHPSFELPIILVDDNFGELFKFTSIPHYIWIDPNGRIKAITSSDEVTDDNIAKLIAGQTLNLKIKTQ